MSLAAMVDASMVRRQAADETKVSPPAPVGVPTSIANQVTRWIPTETITVYVALLALVAPQTALSPSFASRWVLFSIVTAATPIIVVLLALAKASDIHDFKLPFFELIISPVAFAAWAFSLPDTPLKSIPGYDIKWNAAIVTVSTLTITLIANALHRSPDFDQVVTKAQGANPRSPDHAPASLGGRWHAPLGRRNARPPRAFRPCLPAIRARRTRPSALPKRQAVTHKDGISPSSFREKASAGTAPSASAAARVQPEKFPKLSRALYR